MQPRVRFVDKFDVLIAKRVRRENYLWSVNNYCGYNSALWNMNS